MCRWYFDPINNAATCSSSLSSICPVSHFFSMCALICAAETMYFQLYCVVFAVGVRSIHFIRSELVSPFQSTSNTQSSLRGLLPQVSSSLFADLELINKLRLTPSSPLSPPSPSFLLPTLFANIHVSFVIKCGDNLCCRHWLSLLLIDLFLGQNELLCSLLSFILQPPSSSLQLLLKLLRLTKVNGSSRPLLLLFMAIDRGLRWVFIHLAGAWIECVGCLG